ncbi:MAG: SDR family NAD(P)-dependent oxidoreductase [Sphaerochaetaceae bacterium]|jgi:NAD(P)-dependent dehydrogenase (short-subunit alcohol dehydrogenase family)
MKRKTRPYGDTILITGASSGIGRSCSLRFARAGYVVYAVSRHCEEGVELVGDGRIISMRMDVNDSDSVAAVIAGIPDLGIVLHCAGFGISGPAEDTPLDLVRSQFETNYFGILRVNAFALPLLRRRGRSLVMAIGSIAGRVPIPFQSQYSSTKYAVSAYFGALRIEAGPFGVRTVVIEPGDTRTGFTDHRSSYEPTGSPYAEACRRAVGQMERDERSGKDPDTVAQVALRMASRKNPPPKVVVGFGYRVLVFLARVLPDRVVFRLLGLIYHVGGRPHVS